MKLELMLSRMVVQGKEMIRHVLFTIRLTHQLIMPIIFF